MFKEAMQQHLIKSRRLSQKKSFFQEEDLLYWLIRLMQKGKLQLCMILLIT
jgi:hypothetical protein